MSVSPSLPRSTICGSGDAETIVSSLRQAIVSSRRSSTKTRAGMTLRTKQLEWLTVVISEPHCGQMRCSGGTRLNTGTRCRWAGGAPRPGWRPRRFFLSSSEGVSVLGLRGLGTIRPCMGSTSCGSSRSSVSDRGRARRRCASCATSSVLRSRIRTMSARIAVTRSTKRSAAIIFCSHARTSSRSGAKAEVIRSREAIVASCNDSGSGLIPECDRFLPG
jgi:hypothetical protein